MKTVFKVLLGCFAVVAEKLFREYNLSFASTLTCPKEKTAELNKKNKNIWIIGVDKDHTAIKPDILPSMDEYSCCYDANNG